MQARNTYRRFPQHSSPVIGLLGLANAIITCIFPMALLYLVFLSCGNNGCRTTVPAEATSSNPTATAAIKGLQMVAISTKVADDGEQLLVSNVSQAVSYGKATVGNGYQLVNGQHEKVGEKRITRIIDSVDQPRRRKR